MRTKNMYIDKNRAKLQEAADRQKVDQEIRDRLKFQGYDFSACLYCNARLDEYRTLRAGADFILAEDGSYSGAVEQIVEEFSSGETRRSLRKSCRYLIWMRILQSQPERSRFRISTINRIKYNMEK